MIKNTYLISARRAKMVIQCHDHPFTIHGKRYKKLMISIVDLWMPASEGITVDELKSCYEQRYEMLIMSHRKVEPDWSALICVRQDNRDFDILKILKDNQ